MVKNKKKPNKWVKIFYRGCVCNHIISLIYIQVVTSFDMGWRCHVFVFILIFFQGEDSMHGAHPLGAVQNHVLVLKFHTLWFSVNLICQPAHSGTQANYLTRARAITEPKWQVKSCSWWSALTKSVTQECAPRAFNQCSFEQDQSQRIPENTF